MSIVEDPTFENTPRMQTAHAIGNGFFTIKPDELGIAVDDLPDHLQARIKQGIRFKNFADDSSPGEELNRALKTAKGTLARTASVN